MKNEKMESGFVIPPECQGQIVEYAYALAESGNIIERVYDSSDKTVRFFAYANPGVGHPFEPWNHRPCHGEELGEVEVSE